MEQRMEPEMERTRMLVMTGLFAALGCAATMVLQVPSLTGGYLNLGDAVVLLGAYLLGPVFGAAAGGVFPLTRYHHGSAPTHFARNSRQQRAKLAVSSAKQTL